MQSHACRWVMAFQAHSQDEAHVWWPSSVFCLEVLCIWFFTERRLKYIQRYQRLNSNLFFRPRPGQKIIDTMGSDENRDTAKLQATQIPRNEGENCKKR